MDDPLKESRSHPLNSGEVYDQENLLVSFLTTENTGKAFLDTKEELRSRHPHSQTIGVHSLVGLEFHLLVEKTLQGPGLWAADCMNLKSSCDFGMTHASAPCYIPCVASLYYLCWQLFNVFFLYV